MWSIVRRWSRHDKFAVRLLYGAAVSYLVVGGASLADFAASAGRSKWWALALGAWTIFMAIFMTLLARGQAQKRRFQLQWKRPSTHDAASPVPPEVRTMVEQGEKIKAIKRYRQLNPGIGLKEAKNVIDGL